MFLLDKEHEIQNYYEYDAFGKVKESTGRIENRILYTGQQYDGVAEQYYLRARYYNPVIGRFIQEDPYRGDGLNLYAYCRNNPVRYFDPSGYCSEVKFSEESGQIKISISGNPQDILFEGASLSKRQKALLNELSSYGDSVIVNKGDVSLRDLAALTAETGNEFAMFTLGSRRYIIRGDSVSVPINVDIALELAGNGWRWSGHSHPGMSGTILAPSEADRIILQQFENQTYSTTVNSVGSYRRFSKDWSDWLPND